MLTRKHYEQVANILACAKHTASDCSILDGDWLVAKIAEDFCAVAKQENPRFDRQKFLRQAACPETLES